MQFLKSIASWACRNPPEGNLEQESLSLSNQVKKRDDEWSGWAIIDARISFHTGNDSAVITIQGKGFKWFLTDYERKFLEKISRRRLLSRRS